MIRTACVYLLVLCALSAHSQQVDDKGRKHGYWKKKDPQTGKLVYEGEFQHDKPVGTFRYYHANDSLRAVVTFNSAGPASYAKLYHPTGKRMAEGRYSAPEVKDSVWTYYDESGVLLSRETFTKGKREGLSYVYLPDGTLSEEKTFRGGVEEGPFRQYFDGKNIKTKGSYRNGKLEGRVTHLYPNGVEAAAGFYKDGLKNGPWVYRDTKGKVTETELYHHGEKATDAETKKFFEKNKVSDQAVPGAAPSKTKKPAGKSPKN